MPDCIRYYLRLLCFALIKSVASLVVCSDIFPCRSQCIPIKNILHTASYYGALTLSYVNCSNNLTTGSVECFWWRWAESNRRPRNLFVASYNHKNYLVSEPNKLKNLHIKLVCLPCSPRSPHTSQTILLLGGSGY